VGKYSKGGHRFDIRVKMEEMGLTRDEMLRMLKLRNNRGELIPFSELVTLEEKPTLQVISRVNKERAISVHANLLPGSSQEAVMEATRKIGQEILPVGYRLSFSGSSESYRTTMMGLLFALLVGIAVSYMVLASQFNSFIHPATVLLAMPFSVTGAFAALLISNQSLNMFSFIGLILLMGIVKKNSILLVDFTNQKRREGMKVADALLSACPQRLRPILMTSIATVAGAVPAALAFGPGAETRIPMAVAVIGGLITSTGLSLLFVPVVFSLVDGLKTRVERRMARMFHGQREPLETREQPAE
jgi:HAE1 family hydrophobic/amphiphilic exporter-1